MFKWFKNSKKDGVTLSIDMLGHPNPEGRADLTKLESMFKIGDAFNYLSVQMLVANIFMELSIIPGSTAIYEVGACLEAHYIENGLLAKHRFYSKDIPVLENLINNNRGK